MRVRASDGLLHEVSGLSKRVLLQALLVSEGRTVSHAALMEEVWGERIPAGVVNALQAHVSRVRKWLRTIDRDRDSTRLVSYAHGYQLVLENARLDAADFQRDVAEAARLREHAPERATRTLRSALALWRGPVFGGRSGGLLCECAATRINEVRLQALESLFDAELAMGRHALLLGELYQAHMENPLRERFCAQLMLAFYRSGRQAEALAVYRRMRDRLGDELGLDPTLELRVLEHRILTHAPELRVARQQTTLSAVS
ncbi:AfsR/SARP family transcriptional regulator [Streptomyces sp. 6N223]|uniref:AfsR/SARP family transcriptional regulator n=1 Tax=Streptomyces sp. 6N223 TaxID=3457412 RepID=UPI003FD37967